MIEFLNKLTFSDWFGLISGIISITGAIISIVIYFKNKGIRNEIIKNQEIGEYSNFLAKTSEIIQNINKSVEISKKTNINTKLIKNLKNYHEQLKYIEKILEKKDKTFIVESISFIENKIKILLGNTINPNIADIYFKLVNIQVQIKDSLSNKILKK